MIRKITALTLTANMISMPALVEAGPSPRLRAMSSLTPPGAVTLPSVSTITGSVFEGTVTTDGSRMVVTQDKTKPKAVFDWATFNIGSQASVHFDQTLNGVAQRDWAALNRIGDANPTQIYGKLTGDGKVYLINRNGILFGKGSQVNAHALLASSLELPESDFRSFSSLPAQFMTFEASGYTPGDVVNEGTIGPVREKYADDRGNEALRDVPGNGVFLFGGNVENRGTITAPVGQIGLAAGSRIRMEMPDVGSILTRSIPYVYVTGLNGVSTAAPFMNSVTNAAGAVLDAPTGTVGMYGRFVQQNGVTTAVTAIRKNGRIELRATDRISLGKGSVTSSEISDSDEKVDQSFAFKPGEISLAGINLDQPISTEAVGKVEIGGTVRAPSGTVDINVKERALLDRGAEINVSGVWVDKSADANRITGSFTAVVLKDEQLLKDGYLQEDQKDFHFDAHQGSAIGDVSGTLLGGEKTARDSAVKGGTINIYGTSGNENHRPEIIARAGSAMKFAGGGFRYGAGSYGTTVLFSNGKAYDIATAPTWLAYDGIGERMAYRPAHEEGADAGTLKMLGGRLLLHGSLDGSVTRGLYQTRSSELTNEDGHQKTRGLKEPKAGSLILGKTPAENSNGPSSEDAFLDSVVIAADSPDLLGESFSLDGQIASGASRISAVMLNDAGLGSIEINANTQLLTESDASLRLQPGASLLATARSIEHRGSITAPSGSVTLKTRDNITSLAQDNGAQNERHVLLENGSGITLASGSSIDVSGEGVDNYSAARFGQPVAAVVKTNGGSVYLGDHTRDGNGVDIRSGSSVDVSGGYLVNTAGAVSGGNAGSLQVVGPRVALDGDLRGTALLDKNGGTISVHTGQNVTIAPSDGPSSAAGQNELVLKDDRFDGTGFSNLAITSEGDVTLAAGAVLAPSFSRYVKNQSRRGPLTKAVEVAADRAGSTSLSLDAGSAINIYDAERPRVITQATLALAEGSAVHAAPGGSVSLTSQSDVILAGNVTAPAGTVTIRSRALDAGGVTLEATAEILATGHNRPDIVPVDPRFPLGATPMDGGRVTIAAGRNLTMKDGSRIDVSAAPVTTLVQRGTSGILQRPAAGAPGSISLTGNGVMDIDGADLVGIKSLDGTAGGTISVRNNLAALTPTKQFIDRLVANGFDSATLASGIKVVLPGGLDQSFGRSFTVAAPEISGAGGDIAVAAPWIRFVNDTAALPPTRTADAGEGTMAFKADWFDVEGDVLVDGTGTLDITGKEGIRLFDRKYTVSGVESRLGKLDTPADLKLAADTIFPAQSQVSELNTADPNNPDIQFIPSGFTVHSGGSISTAAGNGSAVRPLAYSGGGSLTIEAEGDIEHHGVLAAPMGSLTLKSNGGRVYLAEGSLLSAAGEAAVGYGRIRDDQWELNDQLATTPVTGQPAQTVTVTGNEVIQREGAVIDVSGGGQLFSYDFQPGTDGTRNPLNSSGGRRFVIVPSDRVSLPGKTIYLAGGYGLPAGYYSVLPEQYAFMSGALVVTDLGTTINGSGVTLGDRLTTREGYAVLPGFYGVAGTDIASTVARAFEVRPAAGVLREGYFGEQAITAGNGGSIVVSAPTTILNGEFRATPSAGTRSDGTPYQGGSVSLSGTNVNVLKQIVALPGSFNARTSLTDSGELSALVGTLNIAADTLSGRGFRRVALGDGSTQTVTVADGAVMSAGSIALNATGEVRVGADAVLESTADDGTGVVTVSARDAQGNYGTDSRVVIGTGATLKGSDGVTVDAADVVLDGNLATAGDLTLASRRVVLLAEGESKGEGDRGLYLDKAGIDRLFPGTAGGVNTATAAHTTIRGEQEIRYSGSHTLQSDNAVTLDAPVIAAAGTGSSLSVTANRIALTNSGTVVTAPVAGSGTLNLAARDRIVDDKVVSAANLSVDGTVALSGMANAELHSDRDLAFRGAGSLKTSGDLKLAAARVTTTHVFDKTGRYQGADYLVEARDNGAITIASSGGQAGATEGIGGKLEFRARTIDHQGVIELPAGRVTLTATGAGPTDGVYLNGGVIRARGTDDVPAGQVVLQSDQGTVRTDAASIIDVSAGGQGEAGSVVVHAPNASAELKGLLKGQGGSFHLDTRTIDLAALNRQLKTTTDSAGGYLSGGFTRELHLRARGGDLTVAAGDMVTAERITLIADAERDTTGTLTGAGGNIVVNGAINADGDEDGGMVELYGANTVALNDGSVITAKGTANGGEVFISSDKEAPRDTADTAAGIEFAHGAVIDVAGGTGTDGTVTFQARRDFRSRQTPGGPVTAVTGDFNGNLGGTVSGAREVNAAARKVYDNITAIGVADVATTGRYYTETRDFMAVAHAQPADPGGRNLRDRLRDGMTLTDGTFHLKPVVEIRSPGNLSLDADWDLTAWRFNGEAGSLILSAADHLTLNKSLKDVPTAVRDLTSATAQDSWNLTLVAGADRTGASPLAVRKGSGDLTLKDGVMAHTEKGNVSFASGRDTVIGKGAATGHIVDSLIRHNLGSYGGRVRGSTGRDLKITNGAIQTATGDINLAVGGNLELNRASDLNSNTTVQSVGSIRTTGENPTTDDRFREYRNGGDISIDVVGSVMGAVNQNVSNTNNADNNAWDQNVTASPTATPIWAASYKGQDATEGIAAMGGGDLRVRTGGSFTAQAGTFGKGDFSVSSGGDLKGRFLVKEGNGSLVSMGNFGDPAGSALAQLEMMDARMKVVAAGAVDVGAVVNPTLVRKGFTTNRWDLTYGVDSSLELRSLAGDVTLHGRQSIYNNNASSSTDRERVLPSTLTIAAAGSVNLRNSFFLAPSPNGMLNLEAGTDINGIQSNGSRALVKMTDFDTALVYGNLRTFPGAISPESLSAVNSFFTPDAHGSSPIHAGNRAPNRIVAGNDVKDLKVFVPKLTTVEAGRDIRNLHFDGQNIAAGDVTTIRAGRNISFVSESVELHNGFNIGGPGTMIVQAGGDIDLGRSRGISALGNTANLSLGSESGGTLIVAAGVADAVDHGDVAGMFHKSPQPLKPDDSVSIDEWSNAWVSLFADDNAEPLTTLLSRVIVPEGVTADYMNDPYAALASLHGFDVIGSVYSRLKESPHGAKIIAATRARYVNRYLTGGDPANPRKPVGSLNMTASSINTKGAGTDLMVLVNGDFNVGKTAFKSVADTGTDVRDSGLFTAQGGGIDILTRGDLNVNESRLMTFAGGDIVIWNDHGNVNAGRGARTAVTASPPQAKYENGVFKGVVFNPPAVGSGIRALTYDPDGPEGPLPEPLAGDAYLIVPEGFVDAGEAGIKARKITVAANAVLNSKNISFSVPSVGVPNQAPVSLGSLSGASSMTEATKMMETVSGATNEGDRATAKAEDKVDRFLSTWLDVKFLNFDLEGEDGSGRESN